MHANRLLRTASLLCASAVFALACGGQEGAEPAGPPEPVDPPAAAEPVRTDFGEAAEADDLLDAVRRTSSVRADKFSELLEAFPEDIPLFPEAELSDVKGNLESTDRITVLDSEANERDSMGFYRREFEGDGWLITKEASIDGGSVLSAEKDGRTVSVLVVPDLETGGSKIHLVTQ